MSYIKCIAKETVVGIGMLLVNVSPYAMGLNRAIELSAWSATPRLTQPYKKFPDTTLTNANHLSTVNT